MAKPSLAKRHPERAKRSRRVVEGSAPVDSRALLEDATILLPFAEAPKGRTMLAQGNALGKKVKEKSPERAI
jgi:hypothetical protein